MSNVTFGFIGTGNMGSALARAACRGAGPQQVLLANRTWAKAEALAAELGCNVADNAETARRARYIFLGVKPQMMADLLSSIAPVLQARTDRFVLVSMAAGLSCAQLMAMAGMPCAVLRIMPNTPVAVGAGMTFYSANDRVSPEELEEFLQLMAPAGRFDRLEEHLMDAGSAVAGCGPAFASLFLEALADGGVICGLPRAAAYEYAAQMMLGTAQLYLTNREHPGAMKDAVCSPAGSTIRGVQALEEGAFRGDVIRAVCAACQANGKLGGK